MALLTGAGQPTISKFYSSRALDFALPANQSAARHLICALLWSVIALVLSGCGSLAGPAYERPTLPDKANWSELDNRELKTSEVIQPEWWLGFGDSYLDTLVEKALTDGIDLKILALRLDAAGVAVGNARGDRLPNVRLAPTREMGREQQSNNSAKKVDDSEYLGLSVAWEIDIWGKLAKQQRQRETQYRSTEMEWRGGYLTLVTEVANKYFGIRQLDEQIDNQQLSKKQSEQLIRIYQAQYNEGLVAETNILSQKAETNRLTSELYERQRARRQAELELATLLGQPSGSLEVPHVALLDAVTLIDVPNVLPTDMLTRRPDVLKAEYDLLSAYHAVGIARLKRLPTLTLNAAATTGSNLSGSFIDAWKFAFTLSGAGMFDRSIRREIRTSEIDRKVAAETYRKTVLGAIQDVEVRLNTLKARRLQITQLEAQVKALSVVRNVRRARLREGLITQLELFDTERELLNAKQAVSDTYRELLTETVGLYKALGGGWDPLIPEDKADRVAINN